MVPCGLVRDATSWMIAVELANEPATTDNYELSQGMTPGGLVNAWAQEMATYIRSIDPNHMVSFLAQAEVTIAGHGGVLGFTLDYSPVQKGGLYVPPIVKASSKVSKFLLLRSRAILRAQQHPYKW